MTPDELVRAWKDPDSRVAMAYVDHPVGEIALPHFGGSLPAVQTEQSLSVGCCGGTQWFLTIGCCETATQYIC